MSNALTPGLAIESVRTIQRIRELPLKGTLNVKVGDVVEPSTVIGTALLPGDLSLIRVAEQLGIEAFELPRFLQCKVGDVVTKGTVIAEAKGFLGMFSSQVVAEEEGTVEFIQDITGHVGLRAPGRTISISSYISGVVSAIEPEKNVTVQGRGAFIQGIFGVGGETWGKLTYLDCSSQAEVATSNLPDNCKDAILCGGARPSLAALRVAAERGAKGFISGSIDDAVLAEYLGYELGVAVTGKENIPLTVIITEGFGMLPLNDRVKTLLSRFNGNTCSINGATQVRAGAVRPEIFVPHNQEIDASDSAFTGELLVGKKIRIIRFPYFGEIGTITELPSQLVELPTGSSARVLYAELKSGSVVVVPRANVEIVE